MRERERVVYDNLLKSLHVKLVIKLWLCCNLRQLQQLGSVSVSGHYRRVEKLVEATNARGGFVPTLIEIHYLVFIFL